jgi:hypothetical protein
MRERKTGDKTRNYSRQQQVGDGKISLIAIEFEGRWTSLTRRVDLLLAAKRAISLLPNRTPKEPPLNEPVLNASDHDRAKRLAAQVSVAISAAIQRRAIRQTERCGMCWCRRMSKSRSSCTPLRSEYQIDKHNSAWRKISLKVFRGGYK